MAFLKTLAPLLRRNPNPRSLLPIHTFLTSSPTPAAATHPRLLAPPPLALRASGPLFLSSPPWMLSQSATPLTAAAAALREKLLTARALAGGGAQAAAAAAAAIGWEPKRIAGGNVTDAAAAEADGNESFLNLPNLVSIGRMVSGPVIGWMIVNEWYLPAFGALAISGASDWLDGFLARKMGINSVVGSYLDPLADKVLIGCVAVAMVEKELLHPGLVGLVVFRDVLLVGGAVYKRASCLGWQWNSWSDFVNLDANHREKVEPLFISKVNTVSQLMLVAAALLQPEFGTGETHYITYLSWLVASTTVASTVAYGVQYHRIRPGT